MKASSVRRSFRTFGYLKRSFSNHKRIAPTSSKLASRSLRSTRKFITVAPTLAGSSHSDGGGQGNSANGSRYKAAALLAAASLLTTGAVVLDTNQRRAQACGIVGYVGPDAAVDHVLEGMQILLNRGYDSTGVSTLRQDEEGGHHVHTTKFASLKSTSDAFDLLRSKAPGVHKNDTCGIGHTRWATHGARTDTNAHPHQDWKNRIALVHNGTIENHAALRAELESHGIPFSSETDTEVIAQLLGFYLDQGYNMFEALQKTLPRLHGTYGLAIIHKDSPGKVYAVRNGSPLIVGIGEGRMWIASEHTAFGRHTKQFVALHDQEIAVITTAGVSIDTEGRLNEAPDEEIQLTPAPYPYFTLKEIMEQPEALSRALKYGGRMANDYSVILGGLDQHKDVLLDIKHLMIGACGTSLFASMYGSRLMRMLESFDSVAVQDAAEIDSDSFARSGAGLLAVSQSGETRDVSRAVDLALSQDMFAFSVINAIGSQIARTTNCGVYTHAGREHGVASTKAFVTQVVCLALIAGWFSQNRGNCSQKDDPRRATLIAALHHLPTYAGMTLQSRDQCKQIADTLIDKEHMFVLGKGFGEPIAHEGALKIKEITYVHAEGYSGGALKHGPFALIEEGTPIIMLVLDDKHAQLMRTAVAEVRARGARVIAITDNPRLCDELPAQDVIKIPSNGPLTALLGVIPLQMLAYEMAVARGVDPDLPKNLAKAVTTD